MPAHVSSWELRRDVAACVLLLFSQYQHPKPESHTRLESAPPRATPPCSPVFTFYLVTESHKIPQIDLQRTVSQGDLELAILCLSLCLE